eukprot:gene16588-22652_t
MSQWLCCCYSPSAPNRPNCKKASSTSARIFRFVVVGGLAFVLDAGLVLALVHLGLDVYLSRALSLIVVVLFTFVLNRQATFAATGWPSLQEVVAYVAASLIGLLINYLLAQLWRQPSTS